MRSASYRLACNIGMVRKIDSRGCGMPFSNQQRFKRALQRFLQVHLCVSKAIANRNVQVLCLPAADTALYPELTGNLNRDANRGIDYMWYHTQ